MSDRIRWLLDESKGWVDKGLISAEQAVGIRRLYPEPKAAMPWGTIVFSGIGAVITGLGVILLLAYNWHAIPNFAKLGTILGGLVLLQAVGLRLFQRRDWLQQLGEAACLLGTMLFGSGIWLIAQIYHIQEHYPNGFLIWGLGALALGWAMPSIAQGLLALVVLTIWACSEAWGFDAPLHWTPLLILGGVGALAWRERSPLLLFFVLAGAILVLSANLSQVEGGLVLRVLLSLSACFLAIAILSTRHNWFAPGAQAWNIYGWIGFLLCSYLLTFPDIVDDLLGWREGIRAEAQSLRVGYAWATLAAALAAWLAVLWPLRPGTSARQRPTDVPLEHGLVPLTALLCQVLAVTNLAGSKWEVAGVFNLVFLAMAATWMARGCRAGLLRPTVFGSLLLVALTAARYFDLFESLASRGLVFLLVGGVLIAEGVLFRRARRRTQVEALA